MRSCSSQLSGPDSWISTHTLFPLGAVAVCDTPPWLALLLLYLWETTETLIQCHAESQVETPFQSLALDPLAAVVGIGIALALPLERTAWSFGKTWVCLMLQYVAVSSPSLVTTAVNEPLDADMQTDAGLFTLFWTLSVLLVLVGRHNRSYGAVPFEAPERAFGALAAIGLAHWLLVQRLDTHPHLVNVGFGAAVAALALLTARATAPRPTYVNRPITFRH